MRSIFAMLDPLRHRNGMTITALVIFMMIASVWPAAAQQDTLVGTPSASPALATPMSATPAVATPVVSPIPGASDVPVLAYYSLRLNPDSWDRAKTDFPMLGRYSSDDESIMRQHVQWAKSAGIDGFIVGWRNTDTLTKRLNLLVEISRQENFKLVIQYLALNVTRDRVPAPRIGADLDYFAEHFSDVPVFDLFGKPVVIWYGSWEYSEEEVNLVTPVRRNRISVLASERNPADYLNRAEFFDGNAYYWSSANPRTYSKYEEKLRLMADAVRSREGIWIAPAAPGFDARQAGGESTVDREHGSMLFFQLVAAFASTPDAVGIISWNEYSDNSHIEPSCVYGTQSLSVLATALDGSSPAPEPCGATGSVPIDDLDSGDDEDTVSMSIEEAESTIAIVNEVVAEEEPTSNSQGSIPAPKASSGAPTLRLATLTLLIVFGGFVGGCTMVIVARTKRVQKVFDSGLDERHSQ